MGCGCSKKTNVSEPSKKPSDNEKNILDSPFTEKARRERDGTLVPGQIPRTVTKAYDLVANHEDFLDIDESFQENPGKINPYMEPWIEVLVSPSKYLKNSYNEYYKPPVLDIQPVYLVDMKSEFLSVYNIETDKTTSLSYKIFCQSARAIYLPTNEILVCGGKNSRKAFSISPEGKNLKELDKMFEGREYHSLAYLDGIVLASGGLGYEELTSCELFYNGKWSTTGPLNHQRSLHSSIGLNNSFYVCGGMKQKSFEQWKNGKWTLLSLSFPFNICRIGISPLTAYTLLIVGGEKSGKEYSLSVWEYDLNKLIAKSLRPFPSIGIFDSCGSFSEEICYFYLESRKYLYNVKKDSWQSEPVNN